MCNFIYYIYIHLFYYLIEIYCAFKHRVSYYRHFMSFPELFYFHRLHRSLSFLLRRSNNSCFVLFKLRSENALKHFILDIEFLVTCHQNSTSIPVMLTLTEICVNIMSSPVCLRHKLSSFAYVSRLSWK